MTTEDPQRVWSEYRERKKRQRLSEASMMLPVMKEAGVNDSTILAVDFVFFGPSRSGADALAQVLSEHYAVSVTTGGEGYWLVNGTTRPYGSSMTDEQHLEWVEFMVDLGNSHACVFSTWSIEAPALAKRFDSEQFEGSD